MLRRFTITAVLLAVVSLLVLTGGCVKSGDGNKGKQSSVELLGAGATFPYPFYSKIFDVYASKTGIKVNYQAIGSGGGIRQLLSRTVDFGGTDAFIKDSDPAEADGTILHIPTCLGAVALTYNLEGIKRMRFTPDIVAGIFLGKIVNWNDERIRESNRGIDLPDEKIVVVHRSDGSGTTAIFSDYLSKVSDEWKNSAGSGKSLNWPAGIGGKGNPGVAGIVKQTPGAIGYVELVYALSNGMPVADIRNRSGNYITPSVESVSLAAAVSIPDDTRVSITDTDAPGGYPVSGFTWLIFYKEQSYGGRSLPDARNLLELLWYSVHGGQTYAGQLHYAPLSAEAVRKAENIINSVTYNGSPVEFSKQD